MDWLSRSSILALSPDAWGKTVRTPPRLIRMDDHSPLFHYWIEGEQAEGAPVHYQMVVGLRRLEWEGKISRVSDGKVVEVQLKRSPDAPFRDFSALHTIRPFRGNRTLVRDELEFDASVEVAEFLRQGWGISPEREVGAVDESPTGRMELYGSELG